MWYVEQKCLIEACCALRGFPVLSDEFDVSKDSTHYYLWVQIGPKLVILDQILKMCNIECRCVLGLTLVMSVTCLLASSCH